MAEIINKIYGSGLTGYEEVVADLQKLWDFSPIETATNGAGSKTTTLWINDDTNIKVVQSASFNPNVYVTYRGVLTLINNTTEKNSSTVQMYGVKTNRGTVLTMQPDSSTLKFYNRYVMIGDAENPHTGDIEKAVGLIIGDFSNANNLASSMLASDTDRKLLDSPTGVGTGQRNSIVVPYQSSYSSFIMKSIYTVVQTQSTPFFGECTFNGRKFHSVGAVLLEDD